MQRSEFYCEPIEVETIDKLNWPIAFSWHGKKHLISEVIRSWQDWGFGQSLLRGRNWRLRRHRNCFLVKIDSNEVFEIYYDRGTKMMAPKTWILLARRG
jgi:hypothetical protein